MPTNIVSFEMKANLIWQIISTSTYLSALYTYTVTGNWRHLIILYLVIFKI